MKQIMAYPVVYKKRKRKKEEETTKKVSKKVIGYLTVISTESIQPLFRRSRRRRKYYLKTNCGVYNNLSV